MTKVVLNDIATFQNDNTAVATYNANNATLETAFDNTISRDGSIPNEMASDFDMNGWRILNLPEPVSNSEPLRLIDAVTLNGGGTIAIGGVPDGGATGQVLTKASNLDQDIDWQTPQTLPIGGTTGQILTKNSSTDFDYSWKSQSGHAVTLGQFGAIGNGIVDDAAAIKNCFDTVAAAGGGLVYADPGKTYYVTYAPVIGENTMFDMQGTSIQMNLGHGNPEIGIRFRSFSGIRNGTVEVLNTSVITAAQGIYGACLSLGDANQNGDSVASPSVYSSATNIHINNMVLKNGVSGRPVIQGMGTKNVLIENIYIPSSTTCTGIHFDWSDVGGSTVQSGSGPGGTYINQLERCNAWKTAFNNGTMYTVHPQNIIIRNVRTGSLSLPAVGDFGSRVVRLSACHNVQVYNINSLGTTLPAYTHVGGDFGYEYAQTVDKLNSFKTNIVSGGIITNAITGVFIDAFADNIQVAISEGYASLGPSVYYSDILVEGLVTSGNSGGPGFDIRACNGVTVRNNYIYGHTTGIDIGNLVVNAKVIGNTVRLNSNNGINIGPYSGSSCMWIKNNLVHENGTGGTSYAGIALVGGPISICITDNILGIGGETQRYGISVSSGGGRVIVKDNICREVRSGGVAFSLGSGTDNTTFSIAANNIYTGSAGSAFAGLAIVPLSSQLGTTKTYRASRSSLSGDVIPPFGSWTQGDTIFYENPVTSGYIGSVCTGSGTPGTWKAFGAIGA